MRISDWSSDVCSSDLLLALARNVPQAHASLIGGAWERSKFTGVELHGKVLGILGFGRIGQLVAARAKGFGMQVVAFAPFLAEARFGDLGVSRAVTPGHRRTVGSGKGVSVRVDL